MSPEPVIAYPDLTNRLVPVLARLQQLAEGACLEPVVTQELRSRLSDAETALYAEDQEHLRTAVDGFVLAVQRNMGTEISLRKAFELVDVAIIEAARYVSDPGHVFEIAKSFAVDSVRIESACLLPLDFVPRPPGDGLEITSKTMTDAIRSYRLPKPSEDRLIQLVDAMVEMAMTNDFGKQSAFISTVSDFRDLLLGLQGRYIMTQDVSYLLGLTIFGAAAGTWVCWIPLTWKAQLVIFLGAVGIGAFVYVYNSVRAALAHRSIMRVVGDGTASTQEIDDKVAEELEALDEDDKRELITGLTRQLIGVNDEAFLDPEEKERKRERIRRVIRQVNASLKDQNSGEETVPEPAGN